ncbi:MAG: hypothetical protein PHH49_03745 [Candidatus Omnitrophica bacterium]|nr:hypothetical protein [Candidatus Omnitrophota bacterium]MDD5488062.1 hypothetical protein [Candidatus Omnitrophota bacterium]
MKKDEVNELIKKYQPVMQKTGNQLSKAMKAAEKDMVKMYKVAQAHIELQMKNLEKEKLYHELGKYVAGKISSGEMQIDGLEPFKTRLTKLADDGDKVKRRIDAINRPKKKK